jgi:HEAT repeat protein
MLIFHLTRPHARVRRSGGTMIRTLSVIASLATAGVWSYHVPDVIRAPATDVVLGAAPLDVSALLAAARGAPPTICALAARALRNSGWGGGADAPAPPLGDPLGDDDTDLRRLPAADVERLLTGLAADDDCVREMSARLLGQQHESETVAPPLVTRLGAGDAPLRSAAAFSLGLLRARAAVEPLTRTLRDAAAEVRANSAWALGLIDDGRSLAPLLATVRDPQAIVREAAVVAVGHLDSTSAAATLTRVLRQDESPAVRRAAAWALGQLEPGDATAALADAVRGDADARVREMAAWAIARADGREASGALLTALRQDASDAVRETAAWALGETRVTTATVALGAAAAEDRSARVRGTAAWALGQLGGRAAPAGLLRALRDPTEDVRTKAAWALGEIGDAAAQPALRDALQRETGTRTRRALVRAYMKSGGRSEGALTELLASRDAQVREAAVRGLAGHDAFDPWPWPWPRPRPFP